MHISRTDFQGFTNTLRDKLADHPYVIGAVGLGSVAMQSHQPDQYSDHDFFVITNTGDQHHVKADLSWLPQPERIVFQYTDSDHGMKAIYDDAHMAEFAVFDPDELRQFGRVNDYVVLVDKFGLSELLPALKAASAPQHDSHNTSDQRLYGDFVHQCQIAIGRCRRGEWASGRWLLMVALGSALKLLSRHVPPADPTVLDNLDVFRRFEQGYPALGAEINTALNAPTDAAARALLTLVARELGHLPDFPSRVFEVLIAY